MTTYEDPASRLGTREAGFRHAGARLLALASAGIAALDLVFYIWLISDQGNSSLAEARIVGVITAIGMTVIAAAAGGLLATGSSAPSLLAFATGALISLGVLGIFSIGLPLLVAATLAAMAWRKAVLLEPRPPARTAPQRFLIFLSGALMPWAMLFATGAGRS